MDKWLKIIREQKLVIDILNVVLGILLIIFAVVFLLHQDNYILMVVIMMLAGTINILNGFKRMSGSDRKAGVSFFIGVFLYLVAVFVLITY